MNRASNRKVEQLHECLDATINTSTLGLSLTLYIKRRTRFLLW